MRFFRAIALCASTVSAIWPLPSSYEHGETVLWIDQSVKVSYNGASQVQCYTMAFPLHRRLTLHRSRA